MPCSLLTLGPHPEPTSVLLRSPWLTGLHVPGPSYVLSGGGLGPAMRVSARVNLQSVTSESVALLQTRMLGPHLFSIQEGRTVSIPNKWQQIACYENPCTENSKTYRETPLSILSHRHGRELQAASTTGLRYTNSGSGAVRCAPPDASRSLDLPTKSYRFHLRQCSSKTETGARESRCVQAPLP